MEPGLLVAHRMLSVYRARTEGCVRFCFESSEMNTSGLILGSFLAHSVYERILGSEPES